MSTVLPESPSEPIRISEGVYVDIVAHPGTDWCRLDLSAGLWQTTLHLRRTQLRALRDRLDAIDQAMPS